MRAFKLALYVAVAFLVLALGSAYAQADVYYFNTDLATGGIGTLPAGEVDLSAITGGVKITVTLYNGNTFQEPASPNGNGSGAGQDFLFDNNAIQLSDIVTPSGLTPTGDTTNSLHADGSGNWDWGVSGAKGDSTLSFTVTGASIAGFLTPNNNGFIFAADISSPSTGNTGDIAVGLGTGSPPSVPEPASLFLAGGLLLGWGLFIRRRQKA